jgi:hypothetical protein
MFTTCGGKKNFAGKDLHIPKGRRFQAIFGVNCSRDVEARGKMRESLFKPRRAGRVRKKSVENVRGMRRQGEIRGQVYSKAEGQAVSGKDRLRMFVGCGGKGRYAVKHVHTPKGRACQEKIGWVCSFFDKESKGLNKCVHGGIVDIPLMTRRSLFFLPKRRQVGSL